MKTIYKLMSAAASALVLAACTKESSVPEAPVQGNAVKASLNAIAGQISKSTLDDLTLKWDNGDKIALYQYGWYKKESSYVERDGSKNEFTYGSEKEGEYGGSITNYYPIDYSTLKTATDTTKCLERFYAAFPYANVTNFGGTTCQYSLKVPSVQTGRKADFGTNAIYLGFIRQTSASKPITSYDSETLKFLQSFSMSCVTPVIKFSVPESLGVKTIAVNAYKENTAIGITGKYTCRIDAATRFTTEDLTETITVSDGGNNISGDVYVALAPNLNPSIGVFKSDMDSLVLILTNGDGAAASLSVKISSAPVSGSIKNLKSLPGNVTWKYGKCPGIEEIAYMSNSGNAGKFTVTTLADTLKYATSSTGFADVGEPRTTYPSGDGLSRNAVDYLRFRTGKPNYDPCFENAIVWGFTKSKHFGLYMTENFTDNTAGASCTQYGLTYTVTTKGSSKAYPNCKSAGIDFMSGSSYSKGCLTFSAPQSGTARLMIQSGGSSRNVTVTDVTKSTSVEKSLGSSQGTVCTDTFAVSEGDVIQVSFSGSVTVNSMSFVWEASEVTESVSRL